ncbi:MAG TPA: hypothetical protein VJ508_06045 [Saprospiraceae bacterium]|nr:hypothetical protein [Saprospiraceae bacterium]
MNQEWPGFNRHTLFIFGVHLISIKMKYLLFSLALLCSVLACSKDNNCNAESLSTAIVGKWKVVVFGQTTGDVEFKADGTLIDEDDALIGGEVGGVVLDEKSYTIHSDDLMSVKAEKNSNEIEYDLDISSFSCDEIVFDLGGIPGSLQKK